MKITVAAIGAYGYEFTAELRAALEESVQRHMRAYGVRDVRVAVTAEPEEGAKG